MCYMNNFLNAWLGCDLIVGASFGVPIKRGVVEAIGIVTPVGNGKEKKIKQETIKKAEVEGSVKDTKAGLETKKRKIAKFRK